MVIHAQLAASALLAPQVFAADGELDQSMDDELARGNFNPDADVGGAAGDDGLGGMLLPGLVLVGSASPARAAGVCGGGFGAATAARAKEESEEVLAADGEAFGDGVDPQAPGCFDDEGDASPTLSSGLRGGRSPEKTAAGDIGGLVVTGSPLKQEGTAPCS